MFHIDEDGSPTLKTNDKAGYFDLPRWTRKMPAGTWLKPCRSSALRSKRPTMVAPGQHEIDFKYQDALKTANNIMTFRIVVRTVAQQHGLHATFMPKPLFGVAGSGMHLHISLFKNGENAFYDADDPEGLSDTCRYFIAGVMKHARGYYRHHQPYGEFIQKAGARL